MSVFVCVFVCVYVFESFWLDCLLLLFSIVAAVMWEYFGNPPHLPHTLSCGDAVAPGWVKHSLMEGRSCLGTGQTSPPTSSESQQHVTLSLCRYCCHTLVQGAISSLTGRTFSFFFLDGELNSREAINSTRVLDFSGCLLHSSAPLSRVWKYSNSLKWYYREQWICYPHRFLPFHNFISVTSGLGDKNRIFSLQ